MFWSLAFVMLKIAVASIPPATAALSRLLVAALILWVYAAKEPAFPKWDHWRYYLLLGFVANTLPFLLVIYGMQHIESGIGAILMGAMPVATVILAHFFNDSAERLNLRKWTGVLTGFTAIILLIGPSALSGLGDHVFAELSVVSGALCFAIAAVLTRRAPDLPISILSTGVMVAAAITALPIAVFFDWPFDIAPTTEAYIAVVWLGIFLQARDASILFCSSTGGHRIFCDEQLSGAGCRCVLGNAFSKRNTRLAKLARIIDDSVRHLARRTNKSSAIGPGATLILKP